MILFSLIFSALCEDSLPFNLENLGGVWDIGFAHSNGQFSDKYFQFTLKVTNYVLKDGSFLIKTNALRYIEKEYRANITGNKIDIFYGENSTHLGDVVASKLDNFTAFLRGSSADGDYTVTGFVSPSRNTFITVTSTKSDDVYMIKGVPPKVLTKGELIQKLLPALSILVFMGFGRIYRARFWNQFSQMNTRTLQKRIDEVSKEQANKK